ncbi:hypothetical protein [Archangium lipolyticum]|uniref:hypothetical protein n=1 Tax=Archangium lipolyticum TaxID=2970465 RepID=UPI00214A85F9|nr:hypothetical protein [Archangium lipolyticum]
MRRPVLSALVLASALLTHCRHGPEAETRPAADAGPGAVEPLDLPVPRGQRPDQLRVSEDGRLLFTRWVLEEDTFDYRVVDLTSGEPVWDWRGSLRNGLWTLVLSPEGGAGFVFLPSGPEAAFLIFRASAAPIVMSEAEFTGGTWARGGGWFGGSSGAYNADGSRRGKAVPDWRAVKDELFLPGREPDTVRYMHAGHVWEWNGRTAPRVVGEWRCTSQVEAHRLTPSEPVRFSPEGRYIAWRLKASNALTVCDGESGEEFALAPGPAPAAWTDAHHVWWLEAGAILGMDVRTRERLPRRVLPSGAKAVALAASVHPPALFVGSEQGHLYRLPLGR